METRNKIRALVAGAMLLLAGSLVATAQDLGEAANHYNTAAQQFQRQPDTAIAALDKCVAIAKLVESPESKDLLRKADGLYAKAYFVIAGKHFSQDNFAESLAMMDKSRAAADRCDDKAMLNRIGRTVGSILFKKASSQQKARAFDSAIVTAKKASASDPNNVDAHILIAQCHDSLNREDSMVLALEAGLEVAKRTNNLNRQTDLRLMATNALKKAAVRQQEAKQYDAAIASLTKALEFDQKEGSVYMTLALLYKETKQYALVHTNAKLALENAGTSVDPNAVHFLEAQTYQAEGNKGQACAEYKLCGGTYKETATYQMKEVLKCQ